MDSSGPLWQEIFENCIESVIIFSENGTIIDANKEARSRTQYEDEICGKNIMDIYPMVLNQIENRLEWIWEGQELKESVAYCSNQTCYPVTLRVIRPDKGMHGYGICFAKDITERKKAQLIQKDALEELKEATNVKNEFMANVTHELRTPVNGMKGLAENLLDTTVTPAQRESLEIIVRCCNNMTAIINDLLDFSKIEAGKLTLNNQKFSFRKFIEETMAFNIGKINEKGLKLIVNVSSDIPHYLLGDELRLGQVINNLFSNAVKFTSIGHIALEIVKTYQNSSEVELFFMIIDTGIGIDEGDMDKLFKSFSQVDGSITRRFGGTGLGLAICRQLVDMMGGTIHADSVKDKGSTFSFSARFGLPDCIQEPNGSCKENSYPEGRFVYSRPMQKEADGESRENYSGAAYLPYQEEDNTEDNFKAALETLEKLILCVEMGTWEKAETFAGIIKRLMPKENQELKRSAFRLELSVRKEDYEKSMEQLKILQELLQIKA